MSTLRKFRIRHTIRVSWVGNFRSIVQFVVTYWRTKIWVIQSLNSYSDESYGVMQTFKICLWYHLSGTQCCLVKLEAKWIIRMKKVSLITSCQKFSHQLLIKGRIIKPVTLENVLKVSIRSSKFCALGLCMTLSKKKYF